VQQIANTADTIVRAATSIAASRGLGALTVGAVAQEAGVSTALVHYHFKTKQEVLRALAARVADDEQRDLAAALGRRGLEVLDGLWRLLLLGARSGLLRLRLEIMLDPGSGAVREPLARSRARLPALLKERCRPLFAELGVEPPAGDEEAAGAVALAMDGAAVALATGRPADQVKGAWDAFWLAMVTAGQRLR
jgi:AcrR family transcriptional regulator